jgi:hypothetical protein
LVEDELQTIRVGEKNTLNTLENRVKALEFF